MTAIEMCPGWPTFEEIAAAHAQGFAVLSTCGSRTTVRPPIVHVQVTYDRRTDQVMADGAGRWLQMRSYLAAMAGAIPLDLDWSWQVWPDPNLDAATNLCVCGHNWWMHSAAEFRMAASDATA